MLDKYFVLEKYDGKENESEFVKYIDSKEKQISWWFKNGDNGKDYYAIKYFNTSTKEDSLFYPDWIIKFKNGKIGIFDTKAGRTATDTEGKAEALAAKLIALGANYVGGISVFGDGVWYYNDSKKYEYTLGKMNKDWKKMEVLF